ncbi:MAG TPA: restriction endonuclease, partial [Candidatus Saccharibacteria bacterium]|nr:restriction endonuclease [Candidatus Saccharibacteria bacterium]
MSRSPTRYALQELIGWEDFEKLGTSVLYGMGFKDIKSAGGTKDGGKDAAVYTSDGETTVIQISQEKEPLKETKSKKKSKFWREYEKWADNKKVTKFIFVSNHSLGNKKNTLIETLSNPPVDMYGIDELVNFLDYSDTGKEIKKQYAIFDKDLHEVFGAENQNEKLNDLATVINQDEHYHIDTVLASSGSWPKRPGSVFSTQDGQVIKYFTPKSLEDYNKAPAVVNVTLSG